MAGEVFEDEVVADAVLVDEEVVIHVVVLADAWLVTEGVAEVAEFAEKMKQQIQKLVEKIVTITFSYNSFNN